VSSGDFGALTRLSTSFNQKTASEQCASGYAVNLPASFPYVTAVGGTMGPESNYAAVTCNILGGSSITSAGGFSVIFNQTWYQHEATSKYVKSNIPPPGPGFDYELYDEMNSTFSEASANLYLEYEGNSPGSGTIGNPDIASLANNLNITFYLGDTIPDYIPDDIKTFKIAGKYYIWVPVSGTSASAPITAAMFALVIAERKKKGLGGLGWLNPTLYSADSSMFIDITQGDNTCSGEVCCDFGYTAAKGWDATTGLGQLNFKKALELLGGSSKPGIQPTAQPTNAPASSDTSSKKKKSLSGFTIAIITCACVVGAVGIVTVITYYFQTKQRQPSVNTVGQVGVRNPIAVTDQL